MYDISAQCPQRTEAVEKMTFEPQKDGLWRVVTTEQGYHQIRSPV